MNRKIGMSLMLSSNDPNIKEMIFKNVESKLKI